MSVVPGDLKASLPKLPQQTDFAPPMAAMPATRVIALTNMFTDDDLKDDEAFHEINDDTKQECSRFGTVVSMYTLRDARDNRRGPGTMLVEFAESTQALQVPPKFEKEDPKLTVLPRNFRTHRRSGRCMDARLMGAP